MASDTGSPASAADAARADFVPPVRAERTADARGSLGGVRPGASKRGMPVAPLALGLRILAELLEAGLPLARALAALEELAPTEWRLPLPSIQDGVRQGQSLAAALELSPIAFPPLVVGIIRAGEAGSGLPGAVRRTAEQVEEAAATRAAVRGALAYPLVLAAAGTASIALLVNVVLPRFASMLADLGQPLPATTRIVLGVSRASGAVAVPAVLLLVVGSFAWRAWTGTDAGRERWHAILLGLPGIGTTRRSAATARACSALAALLSSGVPVARALVHAAAASGDASQRARILSARERVLHGMRPSTALSSQGALTPTTLLLIRAGEESGRLAAMLAHAAHLERARAIERTRTFARALEPVLIVIFGLIVALIAAALLQALYSVRPSA